MLATLLPDTWFQGPPTLVLLAIAAVAMVIVIKGADWLVEGAAGIAKRLGMPEVVIGATIVSLGTTSPEMAVSVLAAFGGNAGLALGNGVGSIIADTGLILGLGLLLTRLPADRFVLNRQGWVQFGSGALLAGFCYALYAVHGQAVDANGTPLARIDRWVGIILVLLLVGYMAISVRWARQHPSGEPHLVAEPTGEVHTDHLKPADRGLIGLAAMGLLGLALVVFAGDGLVQSVTVVAERWGVPDVVIASTLVALGTSLPELLVGITAIRKGHPELLVGNVIGADILNVLFVIGFSALAAALPILDFGTPQEPARYPAVFLQLQLPTMLLMLVFVRLCIFKAVRTERFDRWMGVPLVLMYVAFVVVSACLA